MLLPNHHQCVCLRHFILSPRLPSGVLSFAFTSGDFYCPSHLNPFLYLFAFPFPLSFNPSCHLFSLFDGLPCSQAGPSLSGASHRAYHSAVLSVSMNLPTPGPSFIELNATQNCAISVILFIDPYGSTNQNFTSFQSQIMSLLHFSFTYTSYFTHLFTH